MREIPLHGIVPGHHALVFPRGSFPAAEVCGFSHCGKCALAGERRQCHLAFW